MSSKSVHLAFSQYQTIDIYICKKNDGLWYVFKLSGNNFNTEHYFVEGQAQFSSLSILNFESTIVFFKDYRKSVAISRLKWSIFHLLVPFLKHFN